MPLIGWQPPSHQVESSQAPAPQAECETATGSLPIATGPPHPCGGSLHFTALYLLTRGRDKTWGIRGFATLRAGLDQLAPSGPFVGRGHRRCALRRRRRPRSRGADVPYANGPNGPTCLVHRYQTAGSHPAKTPAACPSAQPGPCGRLATCSTSPRDTSSTSRRPGGATPPRRRPRSASCSARSPRRTTGASAGSSTRSLPWPTPRCWYAGCGANERVGWTGDRDAGSRVDRTDPQTPADGSRMRTVPHRVELRGLEPLTLSLRTRCATSCATAPGRVRRREEAG
jgi:hypothetical protein